MAGDSGEFVQRMVIEDLLQRSTSEVDAGGSSLWDYVGCLFDRIAPWPLFILAALVLARRNTQQLFGSESWLLVWCYALIPVVLFTIVRIVRSRSTDAELFLESLAGSGVPRGTRLDITFQPSFSERFILQVVDGYVLNEVRSSTDAGTPLAARLYSVGARPTPWSVTYVGHSQESSASH